MESATFVSQLRKDGYVVLDNFVSDEEVEAMKNAMADIVTDMDFSQHPISVFNTTDEQKHVDDDYFLSSADKIRHFYEEGAVDSTGKLLVPKHEAINKVGHALHCINPTFRDVTFSDKVKKLFSTIGYQRPAVVQSMYIFKQPRIGGAVTPHCDATFLYVEPMERLLGVWIALDDATLDNGCLSFVPGSHLGAGSTVRCRFVRTHAAAGALTTFTGSHGKPSFADSAYVAVPVKKGACVLIDGLVWHKSERNVSPSPRHAYTFHVADMHNTEWSADNWLQETETYRFPQL